MTSGQLWRHKVWERGKEIDNLHQDKLLEYIIKKIKIKIDRNNKNQQIIKLNKLYNFTSIKRYFSLSQVLKIYART